MADLTFVRAAVLGLVEGITEYLPVSSTGHLVIAERLMGLPTTGEAGEALDAYTVIIQLGAIAAVAAVSWGRIKELFAGLRGRSVDGRRLRINLIVAFIPAAIAGVLFNDAIDEHLLKPSPIAVAWIVGGVVILLLASRLRPGASGAALDSMTTRQALIIGAAQAVALIPGTSRSLVTIVAAILVGLSISAAVEFSFLLGLATLSAATLFKLASDGGTVIDTFGIAKPLVGIIVAAVSAWIAVRSFVAFLKTRSLSGFGWYRIAAGVVAFGLIAAGTI
jgi:undecaprenyl-diphosphatase